MLDREIQIETDIDATVANAWSVLRDTTGWSAWNRVLLGLHPQGELSVGVAGRLELELGPPLGVRSISVRVDRFEPQRELSWEGGVGGIAKGRHYFRLEASGDGTRLVHGERFSGVTVPLLWPVLRPRLQKSYERFNHSFKEHCESLA